MELYGTYLSEVHTFKADEMTSLSRFNRCLNPVEDLAEGTLSNFSCMGIGSHLLYFVLLS